ncbi:C4-dicarboxylate TRAP transporter substrate-binding protein [Nitratireductor basaltis]|uniref:TRAP dicarboxylate transporter subunit DctP n=1 Tax=Nitratireductor basaltis TaxID=472175 RepID=A0A084U5C5_9HYPH|nr:C4-dicarboxylate TRAP transporter substrate-binding protein [Nitratireductor basaltis]KFB08161.1 TRAP dicarboxylate transporter subunit DctP [Nitratireductor basaltis]
MNNLLILAVSGAVATFASLSPAAAEIQLRLATVSSTSEPIYEAMEHFVDLVEQKVGEQVKITIHPNGELGSNQEVYEQVKIGAPVIQNSDPGYLSDYTPDFGILNGPYLLSDPKNFNKILESDLFARMKDDLRQSGNFELLATNWLFGARHIIADREVRSPADMEGLTIRVPPNVMWIETMDAMGGRGVQLAWSEVYTGLSTGVVKAAEAPLAALYASKLHENAKTVSMTGHFKAFVGLVMNSDLYASYPQDVQDALTSSAEEAGEFMTDLVLKSEEDFIRKLEAEGVTVVRDVDEVAFREATASVYDAFPAWTPGLHDEINALLGE